MRSRTEWIAATIGGLALIVAFAAVTHLRRGKQPKPREIGHVLIISVDGLSGQAIEALGPIELPELYALAARGSYTWNARTDPQSTVTLPNHISMVTGRAVAEHGYIENAFEDREPARISGESLFDVLARAQRRGVLVSSKRKFVLFGERWPQIDRVDAADRDDERTLAAWMALMESRRPAVSFLHLASADAAGHAAGWDFSPGSAYISAVKRVSAIVARAVSAVDEDPELRGRVAIVITSDHGGEGPSHGAADRPPNFTIPLIVLVPGSRGGELYALNLASRRDPGNSRTATASSLPPIRSADVANLALGLLGLPAVAGSTANVRQDMVFDSRRAETR